MHLHKQITRHQEICCVMHILDMLYHNCTSSALILAEKLIFQVMGRRLQDYPPMYRGTSLPRHHSHITDTIITDGQRSLANHAVYQASLAIGNQALTQPFEQ